MCRLQRWMKGKLRLHHAHGKAGGFYLTELAVTARLVLLAASGLADHATGCTIDSNAGSYVH